MLYMIYRGENSVLGRRQYEKGAGLDNVDRWETNIEQQHSEGMTRSGNEDREGIRT
jgi:hypothetical protein